MRDFNIIAGFVCAGTRDFEYSRGTRLCGNGTSPFSRDHGIRDTRFFAIFRGVRDTRFFTIFHGILDTRFTMFHGIRDTGFHTLNGTMG